MNRNLHWTHQEVESFVQREEKLAALRGLEAGRHALPDDYLKEVEARLAMKAVGFLGQGITIESLVAWQVGVGLRAPGQARLQKASWA